MSEHARLSPSDKSWPHCPGSVREQAKYPDSPGEAAIDGTGTHIVLETVFKRIKEEGKIAEEVMSSMLGTTVGVFHDDKPEGWVVTQDRIDRVQKVFEYLKARNTELGDITGDGVTTGYFSESKSDPGAHFGRTDWWGTCDITLALPEAGVLEVIDYKDGRMFVPVENNSQLIAYAFGKMKGHWFISGEGVVTECTFDKIRMTIIQPKTEGKPIRFTEVTPQQLWNAGHDLLAAAILTDDPNAPLHASTEKDDWCRWCDHRDNCKERDDAALNGINAMTETAGPMFEVIQDNQVPAEKMSSEQLAAIKDATPMINALLAKVGEEVQKRLEAGEVVPGYAMGKGRGSNSWIEDTALVVKKLKGVRLTEADLYPKKLISPAQMKKLDKLQPRQVERLEKELIEYKPGKPTVVKASDTKQSAEDMFGDVVKSIPGPTEPPAAEPPKDDFDNLSFM